MDFLSTQNLFDLPVIVGGDLNTWFGVRDKAVRIINNVVPHIRECGNEGTFRFLGLHLDHLFTTLPENIQSECFIESRRFGSDHYPIVLYLFKNNRK
jgi:endonuclease/exonuclease/phosphatase (EEP) superfamily protein YafD